jgi:hypothetical protein
MFGKSKKSEPVRQLTKEEQLGPKPADIPCTRELITYQVILKNNLPSVEVRAHAHDFGQYAGGEKSSPGPWTNFVVYGDTTWIEHQKYVETVRALLGDVQVQVYRWSWIKREPFTPVLTLRTDAISMVAAVEGVKPVDVEFYNTESRPLLTAGEPIRMGGPHVYVDQD